MLMKYGKEHGTTRDNNTSDSRRWDDALNYCDSRLLDTLPHVTDDALNIRFPAGTQLHIVRTYLMRLADVYCILTF